MRFAVQRFGIGPVVLAAAAVAAAVISWRQRPQNDSHRRRRRSREESTLSPSGAPSSSANAGGDDDRDYGTTRSSANSGSSSSHGNASRKPQWLTRVRRVSIGTVCSSSQKCCLFLLNKGAERGKASDGCVEENEICNVSKGEKSTSRVSISPDTLPALKKFASLFEVYLVVRVDDDSMEHAVTDALFDAGLFGDGLLDRRKLVFCETDVGRVSVARQLESHLHIDESIDVVAGLQRFLQCVAFISPDASSFPTGVFGRNVVTYTTLGGFFPHT